MYNDLMLARLHHAVLTFILLCGSLGLSATRVEVARAAPVHQVNVYDLVNAVNALRASYGLPAYSINSILMFTAQNQADFMAATGNVTHSGPGGIGLTDRLLAAGYPLAGDLSLGGFRAENITSGGENSTAQDAVDRWMGDAPHQNTMLSPDLTEIGAGVAFVNGRVYLVIDCARPTTANAPSGVSTSSIESGATVPAAEAVILPITLSTPNAEGQVIHEVLPGQTLWQIAISYTVKVDDIKRLNNLVTNDIYPGERLLISLVPTPVPVTLTPTSPASATPLPETFPTTISPTHVVTKTATPSGSSNTAAPANNQVMLVAIAILAGAILVGGLFARWARKGLEKDG